MNNQFARWMALACMALLLMACQPIQPVAMAIESAPPLENEASTVPTVTFTATEYAYDGPQSIPGGLTRLELVNAGEDEHHLVLARLEEGKTFDDVMGVYATLETDPHVPEWLIFYGGVSAGPGQSKAYTIDLEAGTYALFSFRQSEDGVPDAIKGMQTTLTVTEAVEIDIPIPVADLRIELVDFSFLIYGEIVAGPQILEITNTGMEPHEIIMTKLEEGTTVSDAIDFMRAEEEADDPPPFEFLLMAGPMNAGLTAWYEVDLDAGEYGLICFVQSPENEGAPHFMMGMVQQVSVK